MFTESSVAYSAATILSNMRTRVLGAIQKVENSKKRWLDAHQKARVRKGDLASFAVANCSTSSKQLLCKNGAQLI